MPQEGKERVIKQLNIAVAFSLNIRLGCKSPTATRPQAYTFMAFIIIVKCITAHVAGRKRNMQKER